MARGRGWLRFAIAARLASAIPIGPGDRGRSRGSGALSQSHGRSQWHPSGSCTVQDHRTRWLRSGILHRARPPDTLAHFFRGSCTVQDHQRRWLRSGILHCARPPEALASFRDLALCKTTGGVGFIRGSCTVQDHRRRWLRSARACEPALRHSSRDPSPVRGATGCLQPVPPGWRRHEFRRRNPWHPARRTRAPRRGARRPSLIIGPGAGVVPELRRKSWPAVSSPFRGT